MHETSDVESYGEGHRTFDCPWCGAISGIDPSHVGEQFECPECHKSTKLTDATLHEGDLTEAPADAPHHEEEGEQDSDKKQAERTLAHETSDWESYGKGHRTFDCPWCGAISGIDPSHLGEHFDCPECHKGTKLTPDNTRDTHVTEAAPDAPHHEEKRSKAGVLSIVAIAAVVGVVAVIVSTGGGDGEADGRGTEVAKTTVPDDGPGAIPTEVPPLEQPPAEEPPAEEPPAEEPPAEEPPAEVPPVEEPVDLVAAAQARLDETRKALALWEQANPGIVRMLAGATVCDSLGSEAARLRARIAAGAETEGAEVTPDQARAFNEAMRAFVAADPERVEIAKLLVTRLNGDPVKPLLLESWEDVNLFLPAVGEHLVGVAQSWRSLVPAEYARLSLEVANAEAALAAASSDE